ncbi:YchJ family protein [Oleidesulfovibrio sp.]|uniref:YchJ family protein n=1 Tax=Oleidesulfovibrio sp. TaxID=2909707 RepID=UPI003A84CDE1
MTLCHCGSGNDFEACCGPLIAGTKKAATAEALMRSRFSAHCVGAYDYLETTAHPDIRDEATAEEIRQWSEHMSWTKLTVLNTEKGGENDNRGVVEFQAEYTMRGVLQSLRETSNFVRVDGEWLYEDGHVHSQTVRREEPKVGRNDPCPCNSGKKYKKCCGKA